MPRIYHKKSNRVEKSRNPQPEPYSTQASLRHELHPAAAAPLSIFDQQLDDIGVNAEANSFSWQHLPQSLTQVPQDPNHWPSSIDATSTTTSTPLLTNAPTPATAISTFSMLPTANQLQARNTQDLMHDPSADPSTPLLDGVFARKSCNCFTHLLEAMRCMNAHTISRSPKLDVVLCANRTAAKHCLTSLLCSHPLNTVSHRGVSSCATIACGLLDRILASYQAAVEIFCAGLDGEMQIGSEEHGDERIGEYDNDEHVWTTARTTTVQLRIGSFALERSEQVRWAREIVAREAEKIQETLKGFEVKGQGARSVLLTHLMERCKIVIGEVSSRFIG
ncbi:MAG: hypothetical protein ASARMPREDX12_009541 [Alectoria sarmentosa]|nr:MAG: hypothetical protein ASARMPREDX12_009541 [Alectoria sarmentosa]